MVTEQKVLIETLKRCGPISLVKLSDEMHKRKVVGFGVEVLDIVETCHPHVIYDPETGIVDFFINTIL